MSERSERTIENGQSAHGRSSLGEHTWRDVGAPVLAIPVGSCEQHGPHLPLDTDTRIAVAVATGLASRDPRVVVTPAIGVTASGEHRGFAGTLSIGTDALESVLVELVRSADWGSGVVFVNGHGGNAAPVTRAVSTLLGEQRDVLSWWPRLAGGDAHAGRTETSLILALDASVVRTDRFETGCTTPIAELAPRLRTEGVASVSPNGVLGDPHGASASEGEVLLASLIDDLVAQVKAWKR